MKDYTFQFNFFEGQLIIQGLKELPMKHVEGLINKLDNQYKLQLEAEQAELKAREEAKAKEQKSIDDAA